MRFLLTCCPLFLLLVLGGLTTAGAAPEGPDLPDDLSSLSISQLKNIKLSKVTLSSRKEEELFDATASIYVITQEDIRRSGMLSIPELLRLVPGLEVAQIDGNKWAITSRGFNTRFSSKMLILVDGRSVYTTVFSGVFWDQIDYPLEDIERIEVIKGPGGTLWGANAVNGVINIITKNAKDTEGGYVTSGAGNLENGFGTARYGVKLDEDIALRVYGKYFNRDEMAADAVTPAVDQWESGRGGFRADWQPSSKNKVSVQGEYFRGESGLSAPNVVTTPIALVNPRRNEEEGFEGGHFMGRWDHTFSKTSDMQLQVFYNRESRFGLSFQTDFHIDTYDLDFQHRFQPLERHEITWGLGQRFVLDDFKNTMNMGFAQSNRTNYIIGGFLQDTWSVIPNKLKLTLGSKISVNSYTGVEVQPSGRGLWTIDDKQSAWVAFSRAVRIPSRITDGARVDLGTSPGPGGVTAVAALIGDKDVKSEELFSMEMGYRVQPHKKLYIDVSLFYNFYESLLTFEPGLPALELSPAPPHLLVPLRANNLASGRTYGMELVTKWEVMKRWRLEGGFSWLEIDLDKDWNSRDLATPPSSGKSPEFQWKLRSFVNLPYKLEWDTSLFYVDRLTNMGTPQYTRLDMRLGWRPRENLELSVGVLNLMDGEHYEFGPVSEFNRVSPTRVPRSGYGKVTFKF